MGGHDGNLIEVWPDEQWLLNPSWLMIIEDYTTQYMGNYNSPSEESLDDFPAKLVETI